MKLRHGFLFALLPFVIAALVAAFGVYWIVVTVSGGHDEEAKKAAANCGGTTTVATQPVANQPNATNAIGLPADATRAQKIAQLLVIGYDVNTPGVQEIIQHVAQTKHNGGMYITSGDNAQAQGFNKAFYDSVNQLAGTPLTIASDEEGGKIHNYAYSQAFPSAQDMAAMSDDQLTQLGADLGKQMISYGITTTLSPVLDISASRGPPDVISGSDRSFSGDPAIVTAKAIALAKGLTSAGVNVTAKHYPGLGYGTGDQLNDSDHALVHSPDLSDLVARDLTPYKPFLAATPGAAVMLSNELVTGIDDTQPASISPAVVNYLRNETGFGGVITTDDINRPVVVQQFGSLPVLVTKALEAGVTMPLFGNIGSTPGEAEAMVQAVIDSVSAAIDSGEWSEDKLNEAVQKVLVFKNQHASNGQSATSADPVAVPAVAKNAATCCPAGTQTANVVQAFTSTDKPVIALDPGHGGELDQYTDDTDTVDAAGQVLRKASHLADRETNNMPEGNDVLDVANQVKTQLEAAGYSVLMLRDGTNVPNKVDRVKAALEAHATLAVSIHTGPGYTGVWPQRVGSYREFNGTRVTFSNQATADESLKVATAMAAARTATEGPLTGGTVVGLDDDLSAEAGSFVDPNRTPSVGNLSLLQLWSDQIPWVYNEIAQNIHPENGITDDLKTAYATGIANGVKASVPLTPDQPAAAPAAATNAAQPAAAPASNPTGQVNNGTIAMNFFMGHGLSKARSAGLVANLTYESGVGPMRLQGTKLNDITHAADMVASGKVNQRGVGWGIAQFTPSNKLIVHYMDQGKTPEQIDTLAVQLQYLWEVLNGDESAALAQLQGASDNPEDAAMAFLVGYERPGPAHSSPGSESAMARKAYARQYYEWAANGTALPDSLLGAIVSGDAANPGNLDGSLTVSAKQAPVCTGNTQLASANGNTAGSANCTDNAPADPNLSPIRKAVVCSALGELALWDNGTLTPANGYFKYSDSVEENWCADFSSWAYWKGGKPISDPWRVPAVTDIWSIGLANTAFHYHAAGDYTPRVGDLVIHKGVGASIDNPRGWTSSHVNIVVAVDGNNMTLVGGNQGPGGPGYSKVTKDSYPFFSGSDITGYVSPD